MYIIIAIILDWILGDPYNFPHPIRLMGRLISVEEKYIRKITKSQKGLKIAGLLISVLNIFLTFILPFMLLKSIEKYRIIYSIVNVYIMYTCIAAKSLQKESMKVYYGLERSLQEGRHYLSYIVGRDTERLNEEGVIKAAVETVGENTSDGVIAPLFYIMLFGAWGGLVYKMVNTMDSMLGYKNEKYIDLGFFPAKIDDVFNYIPARVTGALMCISSLFRFDIINGFKIMIRDRRNHKSPNSAYPESAVAGLLNIQLGGSGYYFGQLVEKPTIGDGNRNINKEDIKNAIEIMYRTELLILALYIIIIFIL